MALCFGVPATAIVLYVFEVSLQLHLIQQDNICTQLIEDTVNITGVQFLISSSRLLNKMTQEKPVVTAQFLVFISALDLDLITWQKT